VDVGLLTNLVALLRYSIPRASASGPVRSKPACWRAVWWAYL